MASRPIPGFHPGYEVTAGSRLGWHRLVHIPKCEHRPDLLVGRRSNPHSPENDFGLRNELGLEALVQAAIRDGERTSASRR